MEKIIPNYTDEIDGTRLPAADSSPLLARRSDEREPKGHASTFPDHARDPRQAPHGEFRAAVIASWVACNL